MSASERVAPSRPALLLALVMTLVVISSCGGDGSVSPPSVSAPTPTAPATSVHVQDVTGKPISGAAISIVVDATTLQATSGADGTATFASVPSGEATVTFNAAGFETTQVAMRLRGERVSISLHAVGEWSLARPVVLGSRALDRSADGSTLTFSVDLAVMDGNSSVISNLAANDFRVVPIDCEWGGPRDCATDARGNQSGEGRFSQDGSALAFALQPMAARRPYVVSVLAERSKDIGDWSFRIPALKSFFSVIGGNDAVNLAMLTRANGASALNVLGPYTRDGRTYLPLIDQLSLQAGDPPAIAGSIGESIRLVDAARNIVTNGAQPMVVVLSRQGLTVEEFTALSAQARQTGVQISVINDAGTSWYGLTELAVRTGGFIAQFSDSRQLQIISGSLDSLLAGSQPFYRITFRIKGSAGTFVVGGNAKVWLRVGAPASIPNNGATAQFDVAIP